MESNNNNIFIEFLKDVCYFLDIDESEISKRVGRNEKYISQVKSRIKKNEDVPDSFVNSDPPHDLLKEKDERVQDQKELIAYLRAEIETLKKATPPERTGTDG